MMRKKKIHDNKKKKSSKFRNRSAIARDSETIKDNGEDGVPSKCDFKGNSGLDYVNVTWLLVVVLIRLLCDQ